MSDFEKENLNSCDYDYMNAIWEQQLCQLGYRRVWGPDGPAWCSPDCPPESQDSQAKSLYDAWAEATGTPTDLRLGMTKEPPEPTYRKPV